MVFFSTEKCLSPTQLHIAYGSTSRCDFSLCFCSCLEGRGYSFWSLKFNLKRKSKDATTITGCEMVSSSIKNIHFAFFACYLLREGEGCYVNVLSEWSSAQTLFSQAAHSLPQTWSLMLRDN